jgi:hypothetical protein
LLSRERLANSPPSMSSQLPLHSILFITSPVTSERGRATGCACSSGALWSQPYS